MVPADANAAEYVDDDSGQYPDNSLNVKGSPCILQILTVDLQSKSKIRDDRWRTTPKTRGDVYSSTQPESEQSAFFRA